MIELALYQPDIPQNTGTLLRLCACWNLKLHLIEPFGFIFNEQKMRRSGMDYIDHVDYIRHPNFDHFKADVQNKNKRIILSTTKGATYLHQFSFTSRDIILMGRESAGVPDDVHQQCDARIRIAMKTHMRSLNMAVSASIITGAAMMQTDAFNPLI